MSTRDGECSATVGYPAGPSSTVDPGPAADQGCKWCEGGDGSEHIEHVPADVWARERKAFGFGPPNDRRKFDVKPSVRPFGRLGTCGALGFCVWKLRGFRAALPVFWQNIGCAVPWGHCTFLCHGVGWREGCFWPSCGYRSQCCKKLLQQGTGFIDRSSFRQGVPYGAILPLRTFTGTFAVGSKLEGFVTSAALH